MNIAQALAIVNDCARIRKLAGQLAMYPYSTDQLAEAALMIHDTMAAERNLALDQLSVVKKQLSMANARAAKNG